MQKKILLPTDFSDNAWNALIFALKLYAFESCTFYLLHSIKMKVSTMSNFSNRLLDTMSKNAMKSMLEQKTLLERVNANANHEFKIIIVNEDLRDSIKFSIKKYQIEMIVMGTKGATGANEIFFGSNTVKTISKVRNCPILTVPDGFDYKKPRKIAFATDFNRLYHEKELLVLKNITGLYNSKINVVHLNEEKHLDEIQEYNIKLLKTQLKEIAHQFFWVPNYTKKSEGICTFIEEQQIDILAMVNYKHSFIEKITKEPVIKDIGFHPTVPFLVIPSQM